jgi:hypothetical protein
MRQCWHLAILPLLLAGPAFGQEPAAHDRLLQLVPEDTGVCLVVNHLRESSAKVADGWLRALKSSWIGETVTASREFQQMLKFRTDLENLLKVSWGQLRDDIFGDAIVFAYRPPTRGQTRHEEGIVLLWARDPDLLGQVIRRLNEVQKESGDLKELTAVDFEGTRYFRRVEKHKTHYYYQAGRLLAFSSQDNLVRNVVAKVRRSVGTSPRIAQQLRQAGVDKSLVSLWVNPRTWDAEFMARADRRSGPEAQIMNSLLVYWKALDAILVSFNIDDAVEIRLVLQGRSQDMPKAARRLFAPERVPPQVWSRFPENSFVRVAGRINAVAMGEALAEFTPAAFRELVSQIVKRQVDASLGLGLVDDILPNLGPDWGLCLTPGLKVSDYPKFLAALAIRPGSKEPPVDQSIIKLVRLAATLLVFQYNSAHADPLYLKTQTQEKVEINYLSGKIFPADWQPAFALKDGYLVFASSPKTIAHFKHHDKQVFPEGQIPIVQISVKEIAHWLAARREIVAGFLADKNHIGQDAARQHLDRLLAVLGLFDHVLITERREEGQVSLTIRLQGSFRSTPPRK